MFWHLLCWLLFQELWRVPYIQITNAIDTSRIRSIARHLKYSREKNRRDIRYRVAHCEEVTEPRGRRKPAPVLDKLAMTQAALVKHHYNFQLYPLFAVYPIIQKPPTMQMVHIVNYSLPYYSLPSPHPLPPTPSTLKHLLHILLTKINQNTPHSHLTRLRRTNTHIGIQRMLRCIRGNIPIRKTNFQWWGWIAHEE